MDQLMNNPQMMAMAQAMMQDPEVMAMMQQPGMMEKLQAAMSNPQAAMADPEVAAIAMKLQARAMGGGGGGMGGMGGMPGFGGGAPAAAANSAPASNIQHIRTPQQHAQLLASAGEKLVVIDYFTTWCGPCKAIAPLFNELAHEFKDKVVFAKVDGDQSRDLCLQQGIQGFPTFEFYARGQKLESFAGADREKLRRIVEEYGNYEPPPPPCPYKHFPLREAEMVKYADIKWEMVAPKFREINTSLDSPHKLSEGELASLDALVKTLQNKAAYHSSEVSAVEFAVLARLLAWPVEHQGPVLNTLRIAVTHPAVAKHYAEASTHRAADDLLPALLRTAHAAPKAVTALLCVRAVVNTFTRRAMARQVAARAEEVLESAAGLFRKWQDENLRLSVVALYINLAILFSEDSASYSQSKVLALTSVQEALQQSPLDSKVAYRCMVVLGTLVYQDANATELARDLDVLDAVQSAAKSDACKGDQPTQQVVAELQQAIKK